MPAAAAAHGLSDDRACVVAGCARDILAAERIAREDAPFYAGVAAIAVVVSALAPHTRVALEIADTTIAGALVIIVLAALALRLVILLHPQFYYPDVRVHALFAWQLARRGLVGFLRHFTEDQFRFSLGLQMENGHWYAFPYPPAFYMLCWPLVTLARMRQEVAVSGAGGGGEQPRGLPGLRHRAAPARAGVDGGRRRRPPCPAAALLRAPEPRLLPRSRRTRGGRDRDPVSAHAPAGASIARASS